MGSTSQANQTINWVSTLGRYNVGILPNIARRSLPWAVSSVVPQAARRQPSAVMVTTLIWRPSTIVSAKLLLPFITWRLLLWTILPIVHRATGRPSFMTVATLIWRPSAIVSAYLLLVACWPCGWAVDTVVTRATTRPSALVTRSIGLPCTVGRTHPVPALIAAVVVGSGVTSVPPATALDTSLYFGVILVLIQSEKGFIIFVNVSSIKTLERQVLVPFKVCSYFTCLCMVRYERCEWYMSSVECNGVMRGKGVL